MQGNNQVMYYLDLAREERKISIQKFVEGITSRRNYSRLLSGEAELSFEMLGDFLTKLGLPLFEFSLFAHNKRFYAHINEIWLYEFVRSGKYEEAFKSYYPLIKDKPFGSLYAKKTLPISIIYMKYKLNQILRPEAVKQISDLFDLEQVINSKYLNSEDIDAITIYLKVCNDEAKQKLSDYLLKYIIDKKITLLTTTVEISTISIYLSALIALTTKEKPGKWDHLQIQQVTKEALTYHIKAKSLIFDIMIFEVLYDYMVKNNLHNKWIIYHYIAAIASSYENVYTQNKQIEIRKEDIDVYIECIKDEQFMSEPMYERLLNYELF